MAWVLQGPNIPCPLPGLGLTRCGNEEDRSTRQILTLRRHCHVSELESLQGDCSRVAIALSLVFVMSKLKVLLLSPLAPGWHGRYIFCLFLKFYLNNFKIQSTFRLT